MYRFILICFFLFLVFAPYVQLPDVSMYDSKRIFQLFLFLIVGFMLIASSIQNLLSKSNNSVSAPLNVSKYTFGAAVTLFLAGSISILQASNHQFATLEFTFFFLLISSIILIAPRNLKDHHYLGTIIFLTVLAYSSIYLVVFFGNFISSFFDPMILVWPERYNFTLTIEGVELVGKEVLYFDNIRFFNHTQTWSIPILIGFLTYYKGLKKNKGLEIILALLVSFWWMLLIAAGARGSLVGIVVGLIILLFVVKKDAFQLLKNGIITLITGGIFYLLLFKQSSVSSSGQSSLDRGYSSWDVRLDLLEKGFNTWWHTPLLGIGPMHLSKIDASGPYYGSIHNFYVQFLAEWGFISFFALSILGMIFFYSIYNNYYQLNRNSSNNVVYLTLSWSVIAAAIHALFSGIMITPVSQIWFVFIASWFIGFNRINSASKNCNWKINYLKIAYIILLVIVLWIASDNLSNIANQYSEYSSKYPYSKFHPRFWLQGLFE